ncbi:exonuclease domain-containing protein [Staphylococcus sp. IVB6214]|uniref:exonuclease domain-containing protein n=1 Tax=Staphylococcus sp. IVB6214 TaxID=2989766 RepID=UPI0021CF2291|nr:exonuclease domain-containing protein [Staphylococcus sp. IVB6214]UXR83183.1 ATP-dependent helicase [Staphylococcus sp. IVB6214]
MKKYDIAVLDFETMNEHTNSPCEVGISLIKGLSIKKVYSSYINPPNNRYSNENAKIHNIPKDKILKASNFEAVFKEIEILLEEAFFVIAHNANFDISVLNYTAETCNLASKNYMYIDSVNIFRYYHNENSISMNSLCDVYNIDKSNLHSAKGDVIALSRMLIALVENNGFSNFLELIQNIDEQYVRFSHLTNVYRTIPKRKPAFDKVSLKITDINKLPIEYDNLMLKNKNIVFTGMFGISKEKLMLLSRKNGANIKSGVSTRTNILVEGSQDDRYTDENGLVSKQRKARAYIRQGADIQIIDEKTLLSYLKGNIDDD